MSDSSPNTALANTNIDVSPETVVNEPETGFRMSLGVQITDPAPCKKHVVVTVPRTDIDHFRNEAVRELVSTAAVPGFRVGRVPRKLVEKRFSKDVADHVRQKVLMQSLEQVAEENDIDAINEPELDIENILIPDEGDLVYEFDVEVRPEFELPDYKGMKLERPVHTVTDAEVEAHINRYLEPMGTMAPLDTPAELGDVIEANVVVTHNGNEVSRKNRAEIRIRPVLKFSDAQITEFDKLMVGVTPDAVRETSVKVSSESSRIELRGETVQVKFEVQDVRRMQLPERTPELFESLGIEDESKLREVTRDVLERQVKYQERQSCRQQILDKITESATWDLPENLVARQVENALRRELLEMSQAGFTDEEIQAHVADLKQRQISMTRSALKQHFILDKIAEQNQLEVTNYDLEMELRYMAQQERVSVRKIRARLEKQGMMENLVAQLRELKAVDLILKDAEFQDVPMERPDSQQIFALEFALAGSSSAPETQRLSEAVAK